MRLLFFLLILDFRPDPTSNSVIQHLLQNSECRPGRKEAAMEAINGRRWGDIWNENVARTKQFADGPISAEEIIQTSLLQIQKNLH